MPIALSLAAVLILVAHAAPAQNRAAPQKSEASTAKPDQAVGGKQPAASPSQQEADEARARSEAKEREWDERLKRTMRSICSGAQGC